LQFALLMLQTDPASAANSDLNRAHEGWKWLQEYNPQL
jgi:hypothetical protein